jgi:hypothetical protein
MSSRNELIPCPGGCNNQVHPSAKECPHCGYQSELGRLEELLGSLSTISSILTGFGLAALVQLANEDAKDSLALQLTTGLWIVSSLLLLGVLVGSELLRRREVGGGRLRPSREEDETLWRRSEWLLGSSALALGGTAVGVVVLGFYFSLWHGLAGCLAVAVGIFLLRKTA